jgi:putative NADH-flavin reductase
MPKLLIVGASQGIGLEAVKQALVRGYRVRAFARSANRMAIVHPNLEKRAGDALDPENVAAALEGVDAVIQAIGIAPGPRMMFGPIKLFSTATHILVSAIRQTRLKRLICVTGFGAGDSRERIGCVPSIPFRLLLGRAYDDKDLQEQIVRNSGLDWTIVRPVLLTNGRKTGRYEVLDDPHRWRGGLISRADVADFLIANVDDRSYVGRTPVVTY